MISVEYDAEVSQVVRQAVDEWLRLLVPRCDPDGRGRLEIRVGTADEHGVRVEVACEAPHVRAIAVDPHGPTAIRRALERVGQVVGIHPHHLRKSPRA